MKRCTHISPRLNKHGLACEQCLAAGGTAPAEADREPVGAPAFRAECRRREAESASDLSAFEFATTPAKTPAHEFAVRVHALHQQEAVVGYRETAVQARESALEQREADLQLRSAALAAHWRVLWWWVAATALSVLWVLWRLK